MNKTIALVSAYPPSSGSLNEYGFHLAKEFAKRDDISKVIILADQLPDGIAETNDDCKIEVLRCWKFNDVLTPFKIMNALRKTRPGGVLFNLQTASFGDREIPAAIGFITPMLTRLLGIKCGVLTHNMIEGIDLQNTILKDNKLRQQMVKIGGKIISYAMTRANYVTTTLDHYVETLQKRHPTRDITMVPHGTFETNKVELPEFINRPNKIVTLGKYGTYKRLDLLLEAFYELSKKIPDLTLEIGGSDHPNAGGYMEKLQRQYGHHERIIFRGYLEEDEIPDFFAQAKLSVFDYAATTGSSGVLHQCSSFGSVPVYPLIGDFIELDKREQLTGYNYAPGDKNSLIASITDALENPLESEKISRSNLLATKQIPLSSIADFHVKKLWGEFTETQTPIWVSTQKQSA